MDSFVEENLAEREKEFELQLSSSSAVRTQTDEFCSDGDDLENLESIFLRYYIRKTLDEYIDYSLDNVSSLQTRLNPNRKTVLYIHGYTENLQRESVRTVVQAYLNQDNHNTIALSYAKLANGTYTKVVKNIVQVGAVVALFLDNMEKTGFNTEKLHIVGHSMGAHVASYISRKVNFSVPRITGRYKLLTSRFGSMITYANIRSTNDREIEK
ncbi:Pancreatic triacylglycerol lipase [Harpegnathos saltator]|uniref:phospholipase A1 n=1 Tax=Harpegnathos saltator TaxID=610380 RepID=E2B632_HARSA|nr:Pancreatic triacylglycerol lipase [Harpegnathos saltator]